MQTDLLEDLQEGLQAMLLQEYMQTVHSDLQVSEYKVLINLDYLRVM
jgi:hypothetical protein